MAEGRPLSRYARHLARREADLLVRQDLWPTAAHSTVLERRCRDARLTRALPAFLFAALKSCYVCNSANQTDCLNKPQAYAQDCKPTKFVYGEVRPLTACRTMYITSKCVRRAPVRPDSSYLLARRRCPRFESGFRARRVFVGGLHADGLDSTAQPRSRPRAPVSSDWGWVLRAGASLAEA